MDGYEFRWEGLSKGTEKGDLHLWGRVIFLPTGKEGDTTGAILVSLRLHLRRSCLRWKMWVARRGAGDTRLVQVW